MNKTQGILMIISGILLMSTLFFIDFGKGFLGTFISIGIVITSPLLCFMGILVLSK